MVMFAPATKKQSKLRMALVGPSGSGKTFTALRIAKGLADGGKIAVVDTERGSASKYSDKFAFDVLELESHAPERYIEAINAAASGGYECLVIDSLSHAWAGRDGILEFVDNRKRTSQGGNDFGVWRDATPKHNALIDAILNAPIDIIVTMRSKTEYVIEKDERGRSVPRKVGMQPVQRDGMEYEFDVVGDLDQNHMLVISKSRCSDIADKAYDMAGEELGGILRGWLSDGERVTLAKQVAQVIPEAKPVAPAPEPKAQESRTGKPAWWDYYNAQMKKRNVLGAHVAEVLSAMFDEKIEKASGSAIQRFIDGNLEPGESVDPLIDNLLAMAEGVRDGA